MSDKKCVTYHSLPITAYVIFGLGPEAIVSVSVVVRPAYSGRRCRRRAAPRRHGFARVLDVDVPAVK